ncbi:cytochrome c oxidase subunit 3 [Raineya orbicola]|uniref:Cytochrome c oxidase subunit III n=1 Tax=Raineya orbicola TaxID=2016530 RepID=A0A2N3IED2_9BACT|nr:cytochrome c oxidase subunit 3 [Raineya orbicola]PKQ68638.1 Cytochrome c oxidase subunit III [Raineya orbicola]
MAHSATATETKSKTSVWFGGTEPFKASWGKLMMWYFLLSDAFTFSGLLVAYAVLRFTKPSYYESEYAKQFASIKEAGEKFVSSDAYWPIPEKIFDAFPFFHGQYLPLVFVGLMTFILIMSSVTMVLAVEAGHRRHRADVEKWMLWTILGGLTFLGCQAWEWTHFITGTDKGAVRDVWMNGEWVKQTIHGANLFINEYGPAPFAFCFFTITGFHGFHVFSGVLINIIVFYNVAMGIYDRPGRNYEMVEKVGLYWHFVDLVWVFVFTFFYLV